MLCSRVCLTAAEKDRRDRNRFVEDEDRIDSIETTDPSPLAVTETAETRRRIRRALRRLPSEQRRLLELSYEHGLGAAEIARRLDLPAATVRTRLRRSPEIVCYAPRRPSLWCRQRSGSAPAPGGGAP